jgi:hypothetical protein
MNSLDLNTVALYVEENIGSFHQKRLEKLRNLRLMRVLRRKNPYLFRAKNILTAEQLVRGILDAYLSSQEETLFGDFLEGLAVFVCEQVYNGYKPPIADVTGIDLIFQKNNNLYIVEVKSGPNWGNSSQINRMIRNFKKASELLQPQYPDLTIVPVNGCAYGKEGSHLKRDGTYWKLCGQDFWQFISGDDRLYIDIVQPVGHQARRRNQEFDEEYAKIINKFTLQFGKKYCDSDGAINWEALVRLVSERREKDVYPDVENPGDS